MRRQAVAILGAGAMGSALVTPLLDNGRDVRLWGTWLDDPIIAALRAAQVHPGTRVPVPAGSRLFESPQLAEALDGAGTIILAVTSDGLPPVFSRALPYLVPGQTIVTVTKGFARDAAGRVILLTDMLRQMLPDRLQGADIVAVGGPSKASEVGARSPTAVTYACHRLETARACRALIGTEVYFVEPADDVAGVEICKALKNAYAIGLGICEGFRRGRGYPHNNLKGALLQQGVEEMARVCAAAGARPETALGLAGCGDLELTGEAGRNRILGELVGGGMRAGAAVAEMRSRDLTVEGYPAAALGWDLARQLGLTEADLPLLAGLFGILYRESDAFETLRHAAEMRFGR